MNVSPVHVTVAFSANTDERTVFTSLFGMADDLTVARTDDAVEAVFTLPFVKGTDASPPVPIGIATRRVEAMVHAVQKAHPGTLVVVLRFCLGAA